MGGMARIRRWRPVLAQTLAAAYATLLPQTVLVMLALVTARRYRALDTFIVAYGLAACATIVVAAIMPAVSPLALLNLDPAAYPNTDLVTPTEVARQVVALRTGHLNLVALSGAQGLVAFPSFHTAGALLLAAAWRHVPFLRWPGLALNAVMLLSVLSVGTHYLVDLLGGLVVAVGSWFSVRAILAVTTSRVGRPNRVVIRPDSPTEEPLFS